MKHDDLLSLIDSIIIREGLPEFLYNETIAIDGEEIKFLCSYGRKKIVILPPGELYQNDQWNILHLPDNQHDPERIDPLITSFLKSAFLSPTKEEKHDPTEEYELIPQPDDITINILKTQLLPGNAYKPLRITQDIFSQKLKDRFGDNLLFDSIIRTPASKSEDLPFLQVYNRMLGKMAKHTSVLLEMLEGGNIPKHLDVLIIAEYPEATILAFCDFLLSWQIAQRFTHRPFPVENFKFTVSAPPLVQTGMEGLVDAYVTALDSFPPHSIAFHDRLKAALLNRLTIPIEQAVKLEGTGPSLLLVENPMSTLLDEPLRQDLEKYSGNLARSAMIVFLESGDKSHKKISTELFSWRKELVDNHENLTNVGPCGQEFGRSLPFQCEYCVWQKVIDIFAYDTKVNNTGNFVQYREAISQALFSFFILSATEMKEADLPLQKDSYLSLGVYSKSSQTNKNPYGVISDFTADSDFDSEEEPDYLKICSGSTEFEKVAIARRIGQYIPTLEFGRRFQVSQLGEPVVSTKSKILTLTPTSSFREKSLFKNKEGIRTIDTSEGMSFPGKVDPGVLDTLAYRYFGFANLHQFQLQVMSRVLTGKNTLAIAATGGGKSECYILPSLILPGVTIVISPLISLMQDQYEERIKRRYKLQHVAAFINSTLKFQERENVLNRLSTGRIKLLFITPEQLDNIFIINALRQTNEQVGIRYLALDEAHCISQWGHNFRPAYLNIRQKLQAVGIDPVVIALTATASDPVKFDICNEIGINPERYSDENLEGDVLVFESNRHELNLIAKTFQNTDKKIEFLYNILKSNAEEPSLVFMPHAGQTEYLGPSYVSKEDVKSGKVSPKVSNFASFLERNLKERVAIYHSKIDDDITEDHLNFSSYSRRKEKEALGVMRGRSRHFEQQQFMHGKRRLMVATKGFGMGVDKSDIRCVIHRTPPANLESYMQEAGRAGRDRNISNVYLLYSPDSPAYGNGRKAASDYEIQARWLREQYINTDALSIFRDFLVGRLEEKKHHITNIMGENLTRLYFTNHEFIDYIDDKHEDLWPSLEPAYDCPRAMLGPPSIEQELFKKGQAYEIKSSFLKQIIEVTYKIRPKKSLRAAPQFMIAKFSVGVRNIILNPRLLNFEAIKNSNYYFGKVIRELGVNEDSFSEALQSKEGLIEMARLLKVGLREAAWLISDISQSRGQPLRYKRFITDYETVDNPFETNSKEIFEKYGIPDYNRLLDEKKKYRRDNHGEFRPPIKSYGAIDSKFAPYPIGWEILFNKQILKDSYFNSYNKNFIIQHKSREKTDWASYNRLLTSYVGVNEDGSLPAMDAGTFCLREVMLGYLNSVELVKDGNCKACSVCVPDLDFTRFSIEERRAQIIRAEPLTILTKTSIESDFITEIPTNKDLEEWIEAFTKDPNSVWGFLDGFSSRLLDDYNGRHTGAVFLRLKLYELDKMGYQSGDFGNLVNTALEILPKQKLNRLEKIVNGTTQFNKSDASYFLIMQKLYEGMGDSKKEWKIFENCNLESYDFKREALLSYRERELELAQHENIVADKIVQIKFRIAGLMTDYGSSSDVYSELADELDDKLLDNEFYHQQYELADVTKLALLLAHQEFHKPSNSGFSKYLETISIEYVDYLPWERIIPSMTPKLNDSHFAAIEEVLRRVDMHSIEVLESALKLYAECFDTDENYFDRLRLLLNSGWDSIKILTHEIGRIGKLIQPDSKLQITYLNYVKQSELFQDHLEWLLTSDEHISDVNLLQIFSILMLIQDTEAKEKLTRLMINRAIETKPLPKETLLHLSVNSLFQLASDAVQGIQEMKNSKFNSKYFFRMKPAMLDKPVPGPLSSQLNKSQRAYLFYLLLERKIGGSRFLTLRRLQAESLLEAGLISELKTLASQFPELEMGEDRQPILTFVERYDPKGIEQADRLESLRAAFNLFVRMYL